MSHHHETQARTAKALRLAGAILACDGTADAVSDPAVRSAAVAAAGVREPSETTWAMVESMVRFSNEQAAPADPFAGLA